MQVELGLLTFHVVTRHFTVLGVCVGVLRDVTVLEHSAGAAARGDRRRIYSPRDGVPRCVAVCITSPLLALMVSEGATPYPRVAHELMLRSPVA
jgi:hypothetical protein